MACSGGSPGETGITVSAASSLTFAFGEIAPLFERETGVPVTLSFGATGQLALQIEQGAPVHVLAAAGAGFIDRLGAEDMIAPETRRVFCRGDLVLWVRDDSGLVLNSLDDLLTPRVRRIAAAHPVHAPYGTAARQALVNASVWDRVQSKLVLAQSVRQALQYAETGDVDVALVPRALAARVGGRWVSVSADLYDPVDHIVAVVGSAHADSSAHGFVEFLLSPTAQAILRQHGFRPLDRSPLSPAPAVAAEVAP